MTSLAQSNSFLCLSLVGQCATISLAAPTLASHLGIRLNDAEELLTNGPCLLANRLESSRAKRLATLLRTLGVPIRLDPASPRQKHEVVAPSVFDLSIQPLEAVALVALAKSIARRLPTAYLTKWNPNGKQFAQALSGPGGIVLSGLTGPQINQVRRALRPISGLRLATSNPLTSRYDILQDPRHTDPLPREFEACLQHLGLTSCGLTGAVAARVDATTCGVLMKRFAKAGLVAFNRDFQRFDLFLTGIQNVSPQELADFLVMRSDLPRKLLERMPHPLKIETGLTRANALAFQSDYAALGLETYARLRVYHPLCSSSTDRV